MLKGKLPGFVATNALKGIVVRMIGGSIVNGAGEEDYKDEDTALRYAERDRDRLLALRKGSGAIITSPQTHQVNGFLFSQLLITQPLRQVAFGPVARHSCLLKTVHGGRIIVLEAEGETGIVKAVEAATAVAAALHPLPSGGQSSKGNFEDRSGGKLGFEAALDERGWQAWPEARQVFPGNVGAARLGQTAALIVIFAPVPKRGLSITEHMGAVMRICTRFEDAPHQFDVREVKMPPFDEALSLSLNAEGAKDSNADVFRGWFGQGQGRMMLVLTWTAKQNLARAPDVLETALASVRPLALGRMPGPEEFTDEQRALQSSVLAEIGTLLLRRGRNEDAAQAYETALEYAHTQIATLEAAVTGLQQCGARDRAEALLQKHWAEIKDSPRVWLMRARLHVEAGRRTEARTDFAAAFIAGLRDEAAMIEFIALMWQDGLDKEALRFLDSFEKVAPSPRITRWRAVTLARMKDYDQAFALYASLVKTRPLDVEAALQYGEFANQAGKHAIAREMVALLLGENQDGARLRLMEGWTFYGQKQWREAKLSFEAARKFAPNDPVVLDALNAANASLGEGDSSQVKDPIEPLTMPPTVRERLAEAAAAFKPGADESAVVRFHLTQVRYQPGQPTVSTTRREVRVLDTAGVDSFSTLDIAFDPLSERVFVNQLEVRDESGAIVARGKSEDQFVTDPSLSGPATLGRVLRVPVPGLKPGRVLGYTFTRRTVDPDKVMRFDAEWFSSVFPAAAHAVVIEGSLPGVLAEMNAPMKQDVQIIEEDGFRAWIVAPVPQLRFESLLPRLSHFVPRLCFGAPDGDWGVVGREYLDLIKDQLQTDPEIEVLAKSIIAGAKSDEEKADRLSRHVREEITYKAIEFGRRARIPNRPGRVVANHYGDCKDMSLLLHHLLRAAGITSHLALINTRADIAVGLPDLDQFNHVILHVPGLKSRFVDCTEGKSGDVHLPPALHGLGALVLDPDKPRVMTLPARSEWPPDSMHVDRVVSYDSALSAEVTETVKFTGYVAQNMRGFLNSLPPERRLSAMQGWQQRASHWQLDKIEAADLDRPAVPLTLKLRYSMPPPAQPAAGGALLPAVLEQEYLEVGWVRHRYHPFELLHPMIFTSDVRVIGTTAVRPEAVRSLIRSGGSARHCEWSMKAAVKPGAANECDVHFEARLPGGMGAAADYAELWRAAAGAVHAWNVPLQFERTGDRR